MATPLRSELPNDVLSYCLLEKGQLIIKSGIPKEQEILGKGWVLHSLNTAPCKAIHEKRCFLRQDIGLNPHKYRRWLFAYCRDKNRHYGPTFVNMKLLAPKLRQQQNIRLFGERFYFCDQLADQLAVASTTPVCLGRFPRAKEWGNILGGSDKLFLLTVRLTCLR